MLCRNAGEGNEAYVGRVVCLCCPLISGRRDLHCHISDTRHPTDRHLNRLHWLTRFEGLSKTSRRLCPTQPLRRLIVQERPKRLLRDRAPLRVAPDDLMRNGRRCGGKQHLHPPSRRAATVLSGRCLTRNDQSIPALDWLARNVRERCASPRVERQSPGNKFLRTFLTERKMSQQQIMKMTEGNCSQMRPPRPDDRKFSHCNGILWMARIEHTKSNCEGHQSFYPYYSQYRRSNQFWPGPIWFLLPPAQIGCAEPPSKPRSRQPG